MRRTIASWLTATLISVAAHAYIATPALARQPAPAINQPAINQPTTIPLPEFDASAATQRTIQQLSTVLTDPYTPPAERDEAARRLLLQPDPSAKAILLDALREQSVASVAIARAIAEVAQPDPEFIEPLLRSFGANKNLTEAAGAALGNYRGNGTVLARLIEVASNRQRHIEDIRLAAIRALGSFSEKRSAEALINLIRNPNESPRIRGRANDALVALSAIAGPMDFRRWDEWWNANSRRNEDDFRAEMLARKAAARDRELMHANQLVTALQDSLREQYATTPQDQRDRLLIGWLRSAVPEIRAHAAVQIYDDFLANKPVAPGAYDELRKMIGDSSPLVRQRVALTLGVKNDTGSLEPLLQQLSQETDADVRQQIAMALQSIRDVRAAPFLVQLLNDDSPAVVRAAVGALQPLGKAILEQKPQLAEELATTLQRIIERTASTNQVELRADAIATLVPLKRRELVRPLFLRLLRANEEPRVRIAAMQALGEIGDNNAAPAVLEFLNDPDDTVVLQAVKTLGQLAPTPDQANALLPLLLGGRAQNDPAIIQEAWRVLESSFPSMSNEQLSNLAEKFRGVPARQIAIRRQLQEVLTRQKDLDRLATTQSQIARNYMELQPPQPDMALPFFRAALEYRQGNREAGPQVDELIDGYMQAALKSNTFPDAIAFAEKTLRTDADKQAMVGSLIRSRVEDLGQVGTVDELKRAADLIQRALNMKPPLSERYLAQLRDAQKTIEQRLATATQGSGGPRSASGFLAPATTTHPAAVAGNTGN